MVKRTAASLVLGLIFAANAAAQLSARGQFFLSNGNLPSQPIQYLLTRDDGQVNEWGFSDSNGRFVLQRLNEGIGYRVVVNSDGSTYGDTAYSFIPTRLMALRITLNPPPRKSNPPGSASGFAISAASGYKPAPEAAAVYDKALKEIEKKRYDAAERLLRRAVELDPKFVSPLNDLGVLLMQQKKYPEAEKILRRALEADSKSIHALLNLGITLNHLREYADAIAPLREALRLEPGLVAAHQHLGIALLETEQFDEAEKELTIAGKSSGADAAMIQLYLGKLYARTGEFEKSIAAFNNYLQKAPNAPNAGEVRALIERMKKELATRH